MSRRPRITAAICALVVLALLSGAAAAQDNDAALPSPLVSSAVLEAKIAETQEATDLTDEARERLTALYRKALTNLEAVRANQETAAAYG
ncbi:MAG: hypothetical protein WAK53_15250, partial [Chromatiaceae bacterium]